MIFSLNECNWQLKGYWPYVPEYKQIVETDVDEPGVCEWIPASVPGSIHADLLRAGIIKDPYFGVQSVECEWIERRWWRYRTTFSLPENDCKKRFLRFDGVDYKASFYLDRVLIGKHEGMFTPVVFDISDATRDTSLHQLDVIIEGAPEEYGEVGITSKTTTQKSRFGYKWDFGTRLVNLGIWKDVGVHMYQDARFEDVCISTDVADGEGLVDVTFSIDGPNWENEYTIEARLRGNGAEVAEYLSLGAGAETGKVLLRVNAPALWNPNGYGAADLYTLTLTLLSDKRAVDSVERQVGIRSLRYASVRAGSLPYQAHINGKSIHYNGINLVPLDMMYGAVTQEDYAVMLRKAAAMGVNLIRVWGGGLIEKQEFYDLCDKLGILVWQDMIQSSSGVDSIPCEDENYLELLRETSEAGLCAIRNHVCLTFLTGGNELIDHNGQPVTYENRNIGVLKEVAKRICPWIQFLPTTGSGPNALLNVEQRGRNHDVHGPWKYQGADRHYKLFNNSDSMLHSEFGIEALCSLESMRTFLPESSIQVTSVEEDLVWRHHGEWWDVSQRDTDLFGRREDLAKAVLLSQYVQADCLAYSVGVNQQRMGANAGSILWQFNEPWPNVGNTSVIEHSGRPKMAYYWLKQAFSPVHLSFRCESNVQKADQPFELSLFVVCTERSGMTLSGALRIRSLTGENLCFRSIGEFVPESGVNEVMCINELIPKADYGLVVVEAWLNDGENHCVDHIWRIFAQRAEVPFAALQQLPDTQISMIQEEDGWILKNTGDFPALFVSLFEDAPKETAVFSDGGLIIWPGDVHKIKAVLPEDRDACRVRLQGLNLKQECGGVFFGL